MTNIAREDCGGGGGPFYLVIRQGEETRRDYGRLKITSFNRIFYDVLCCGLPA